LLGKEGASKEKDSKMWDAWKARKEELEKRKETALKQFNANPTLSSILHARSPQQQDAVVEVMKVLPTNRVAVVRIMEGLLGLITDDFFEKSSEEDTALLQPSATTILQLSARLSALGSKLLAAKVRKEGPDGR
jgi:hypothetical protein